MENAGPVVTNTPSAVVTTSLLYLTDLIGDEEACYTTQSKPFCYLLEIDNCRILLDCGAAFQVKPDRVLLSPDYSALKNALKDVSAVFCSHASLEFIGGLPLIINLLPGNAVIYMTIAAQCMARVLFSDLQSNSIIRNDNTQQYKRSETVLFDNESLELVFSRIVTLRYSQSIQVEKIIISPFAAGASLGGAYWRIRKGTDDIIYAVGISTKKESNTYPSVLITDADLALTVLPSRKLRDTELVDLITAQLNSNPEGDILIVAPATGKILEIVLLLDGFWQQTMPTNTSLILTGMEMTRLIDFAQSMLEWMGESILKAFSQNRENPFALRHTKCITNLPMKESGDKTRRVVLLATSDQHLQLPSSYALHLFLTQFASHPRSLVVFTSNLPPTNSFAFELLKFNGVIPADKLLNFKYYKRSELTAQEIGSIDAQREKKHSVASIEDHESDEEEDTIMDTETDADQYVSPYTSFEHTSKSFPNTTQNPISSFNIANMSFPYKEKKRHFSPYGEILDPSDWPLFEFHASIDQNQTSNTLKSVDAMQSTLGVQLSMLGVLSTDSQNRLSLQNTTTLAEVSNLCRIESIDFPVKIECKIQWMDFFIKSDSRALKSLLAQLMPKKLVLIHSDSDESTYLSQWYKISSKENSLEEKEPSTVLLSSGTKENISELTNIFNVKLSESLVSSLLFSVKESYEIAKVKGTIKFDPELNLNKEVDMLGGLFMDLSFGHQRAKQSTQKACDDVVQFLLSENKNEINLADIDNIQILGPISLPTLMNEISVKYPFFSCTLGQDSQTLFIYKNTKEVAQISKNSKGELDILGALSHDFILLKKDVSERVLKL